MKTSRIKQEQQTVEQMIRLYCRRHEGNEELCSQCQELLEYAQARLSRCPFGEKKTTCKLCPVHCYKPEMKGRMRKVMRYAGPRMLLYHPLAVIRHLWRDFWG
ncbi:nitrous oxide-stimulated promoter family protein [Bacteroides helcogenes]|uniref:Nitrous oxide-stimulated promoter family protein n=1 Tax=Bacteroides helcogenes (strain ATCC 35417 / DSM 20613 / JCM 6297 / CCUG 15421 / P 36-108) TaxID=693979 RepID=E6SWP9_BACT6|nr:nitrous oxide-stimulated promoter family protein [Bacteroides helcogenes]ADV43601.1 hypothetical protein Bache_1596 [Bacteroides helcogenes P 36-108]MDY5239323.1 nitrous oxide-stimulated promoter family protein [Bacteroides helcogenes]